MNIKDRLAIIGLNGFFGLLVYLSKVKARFARIGMNQFLGLLILLTGVADVFWAGHKPEIVQVFANIFLCTIGYIFMTRKNAK